MDRAHRIARKQEEVTAINHGGRGTPASGSGSTVKNDVRNADWSFEVKTTTQKTYSLAYRTWITAERHALTDGRKPALVIAFDRGLGTHPKRLVVIDEDDFLELIHEANREGIGEARRVSTQQSREVHLHASTFAGSQVGHPIQHITGGHSTSTHHVSGLGNTHAVRE